MVSKFYLLDKKRQIEIVNAGFEVFGRYEYAKASTETIAKKAGISKGLLFFYFKNKKEYFTFLYKYAEQIFRLEIDNAISSSLLLESGLDIKNSTTDFFEVIEIVTQRKYAVLERMPYILTFMLMSIHSKDEIVRDVIAAQKKESEPLLAANIFQDVVYDKFRTDVEPSFILEMFGYLLDGYIQTKLNMNEAIVLEELMQKYKLWAKLLRRAAYQEDELKGEGL